MNPVLMMSRIFLKVAINCLVSGMSKFDVKNCIDKNIYRVFNLISDLYFYLNIDARKVLSRNSVYHNRHLGERCFILGTGPSLNELSDGQISKLMNETVIAVNSIYKAQVVSQVSPKYYALLDNNYWGVASYTFDEIIAKYQSCPPVFITDLRAKSIVPEGFDSIYLYAKNYPVDKMRCDLSRNLSITMNVIGFSILSAIYMGFKEIYLLGCDYNLFCSRIGTHCYDDQEEINELPKYNLSFYLKYYHLTTEFHYMIASLARQKKLKIVNLSESSLLDAYQRIDASKVL